MIRLLSFLVLPAIAYCVAIKSADIDLGPDYEFRCAQGGGAQPHPENCWLYYTCYAGETPRLWQCRDDMLFDLRYSGCNYPSLTDCGNRLRPGQTPPPLPPFSCPVASGSYPIYSGACDAKYYVCTNWVSQLHNCAGGHIFDVSSSSCVPAEIATCRQITTAQPQFQCPTAFGYYPHPTTCTKFYQCSEGVAYLHNCQPGLYYNPALIACDWPANVPSCHGR